MLDLIRLRIILEYFIGDGLNGFCVMFILICKGMDLCLLDEVIDWFKWEGEV
ncbi:unnamed protein product [Penicillium salamii]|nr:unnamed protein product [Penicillium salamii]